MDSVVFIGLIVVAVVDAVKDLAPKVQGSVTVLVAGLVGLLVAAVDTHIGLNDIPLAVGFATGLAAAGGVGIAKRIG